MWALKVLYTLTLWLPFLFFGGMAFKICFERVEIHQYEIEKQIKNNYIVKTPMSFFMVNIKLFKMLASQISNSITAKYSENLVFRNLLTNQNFVHSQSHLSQNQLPEIPIHTAVTHNLLLWISAGRRRRRSRRSCPRRPAWRRSSSPWLSRCPPWPGPGRSQEAPRGRRTRSGCCRSARGQWRRSWSEGSETGRRVSGSEKVGSRGKNPQQLWMSG